MLDLRTKSDVFLRPIGIGQTSIIEVDQSAPWMQEILDELHEDVKADLKDCDLTKTYIRFKADLQKKSSEKFLDHAFVLGEIEARYYTYCITSGELMLDDIFAEVQAVFLEPELQKSMELEDEITIYFDQFEYDLYYLSGLNVPLRPLVNEYVFLNKNPYPKLEQLSE
jgi:hypothetical protein